MKGQDKGLNIRIKFFKWNGAARCTGIRPSGTCMTGRTGSCNYNQQAAGCKQRNL